MLKDYNYSDIPENEEYKLYGIIIALLELIRSDLKSLNVPKMRSIRVSAEKSMDYRYNYIGNTAQLLCVSMRSLN